MTISPRIHRVHRWNSVHVDPLSVLDILDVHVTNSYFPPPTSSMYPLPLPYMSLLPLSFPLLHPFSISHQPCILSYMLLLLLLLLWLLLFFFLTESGHQPIADGGLLGLHRDRPGLATSSWHQRESSQCKYLPTYLVPCSSWGVGWGSFTASTSCSSFPLLWCPSTP